MRGPEAEANVAEASFEIINERGLHARAATKLVQVASRYACEVTLFGEEADGVNAKSVMGVLLLCGAKGTTVRVRAQGTGAAECVDAIGQLIAQRFGEAE
jgi:phosphocarrier protein HPr